MKKKTHNRINVFFVDGSYYVSRMAGYFLYVSNTNSTDDAHLCFHHNDTLSGKPTINEKINCLVRGRYVIYYNERRDGVHYPYYYSKYAYNEICELEVFGESKFLNGFISLIFFLHKRIWILVTVSSKHSLCNCVFNFQGVQGISGIIVQHHAQTTVLTNVTLSLGGVMSVHQGTGDHFVNKVLCRLS